MYACMRFRCCVCVRVAVRMCACVVDTLIGLFMTRSSQLNKPIRLATGLSGVADGGQLLGLTSSRGRNISSCRRTPRHTHSPCRVLRSMHTNSSWPTPAMSTPFTCTHRDKYTDTETRTGTHTEAHTYRHTTHNNGRKQRGDQCRCHFSTADIANQTQSLSAGKS